MKIDSLQGERYNIALDLLLQRKEPLVYSEVVFYWHRFYNDKQKKLTNKEQFIVSTYSDFLLENTTQEMARQKIQYSKDVLNELISNSEQLKNEISNYEIEYQFGIDYGKGGFNVAVEKNGLFHWLQT